MMEKLVMIKEQLVLSEPGRIEGNGGTLQGIIPTAHCREYSLSNSRRCEAPNVRAMRLALACHGN